MFPKSQNDNLLTWRSALFKFISEFRASSKNWGLGSKSEASEGNTECRERSLAPLHFDQETSVLHQQGANTSAAHRVIALPTQDSPSLASKLPPTKGFSSSSPFLSWESLWLIASQPNHFFIQHLFRVNQASDKWHAPDTLSQNSFYLERDDRLCPSHGVYARGWDWKVSVKSIGHRDPEFPDRNTCSLLKAQSHQWIYY